MNKNQHLKILNMLFELQSLSLSDNSLEQIFKQFLELIFKIDWLSIEKKGCIFLVNKEKKQLEMIAYHGLGNEILTKCKCIPFGKCLCGKVALTGTAIISRELNEDHEIGYDGMMSHGHYCIPMKDDNTLIGVLNLYIEHQHETNEHELGFLQLCSNILTNIVKFREIQQEKIKLYLAIEQISECIVITNQNAAIEYVNDAFEKITGYKKDEIIGKNLKFLVNKDSGQSFYDKMWKTICSGNIWQGNLINKNKEGNLYEEEVTITPILGDDNKGIINYIAIKRDVSEQKKLEVKLRHSQKMKAVGTLAAGIAHEINTPMQYISDNTMFLKKGFNKIIDYLDSLKDLIEEVPDTFQDSFQQLHKKNNIDMLKSEIPESLDDTIAGIDRVSELVHAMKEFSHPGKKEKSYADINKAIETTITISSNVWKYIVDISTDLSLETKSVYCNINDISQVVLNLIINASDSIVERMEKLESAKGKIEIRTRKKNDYAIIEVYDNGMGISEEVKNRVFEPFFTTKKVGKGTGQGLSIVHDIIVNKHGGAISIDSTPNKGTTFTVSIPIEKTL